MDPQLAEEIKKRYRTLGDPIAFSGISTVEREYKNRLTKKQIREILESIDSYVLHREYKQPRTFNPYFVNKRREFVQADLIDVRNFKKYNSNIQHILLLIDVFTKKVWLYPLKTKSAEDIFSAFNKWIRLLSGDLPEKLTTDAGKEFVNRKLHNLLNKNDIEHQLALGTSKAAIAERANKTIQTILYKYLSEKETYAFLNKLQKIAETYNNRSHLTLNKKTPNFADEPKNEKVIKKIHLARFQKIKRKNPRFTLGQLVRLKLEGGRLAPTKRAYAQQFTGEYFIITRINKQLPIPMYYVRSLDTGEHIEGSFYEQELTAVKGDAFKIKILKYRTRKGRREALIRWKYFGPQWDEWRDVKELEDI